MPIIIIPEKICKHCGGNEWRAFHYKYKGEMKTYHSCAIRLREKQKEYWKSHPEYLKKYHHTTKGKEALERARKKERDTLSNNYLRNQLYVILHHHGYKLDRKSVTQDQIDKYRQSLTAKRTLQKIKNGNLREIKSN
jgi:hypothetical protein